MDEKLIRREILLALWKVHILHHATERPVFGQWMLEELRRHGHDVSPGTLYPLLERMRGYGWLRCEVGGRGPRARKDYFLTDRGQKVLRRIRTFVNELHGEINKAEQ
jgi:PadR family transcriptional regulator, regulatory protein PadR